MVLDSDSDSDSNEEDEEEYDQGRAGHTTHQSHAGYRPMPGENSFFSLDILIAPTSQGDTRGGADEPIEIESSSDEEVGFGLHRSRSQI